MVAMRNILSVILMVLGLLAAGHSQDEKKRLLLDSEPSVDIDGKLAQMQAQMNAMQSHFENITSALKQENERLKQNVSKEMQTHFKNITTALKVENEQLRRAVTVSQSMQTDINNMENITTTLKEETEQLKQAVSKGSGSVYVRWGRTVCPSTASIVYTGYTAGRKFHGETGSGADNLCLPSDTTWSKFVDGLSDYRGYIYGTEIDTIDTDHIFNYPVNEQDMPCVVCRSTNPSIVMIPARNNCYPGWTEEYSGYLMAGEHKFQAYDHVCIDVSPEFLQHGSTNDNQHILYLVEGVCGSLPCPPYVEGRELACVVCSK